MGRYLMGGGSKINLYGLAGYGIHAVLGKVYEHVLFGGLRGGVTSKANRAPRKGRTAAVTKHNY